MKPIVSWATGKTKLQLCKKFDFDDLFTSDELAVFVRGNGYFTNPVKWLAAKEVADLYQSSDLNLSEIDGSFVILIHDKEKSIIQVTTDHLNFFPIYFHVGEKQIVLTDSLTPHIDKKLNRSGLKELFTIGNLLGEKTIFEGVEKIPAASIAEFGEQGMESCKIYWNCSPITTSESKFKEVFSKTIGRIPKLAKKPTLTLTAGLDSRMVLSELLKQKANFSAFTYGYRRAPDMRTAKRIAKDYRIKHCGYEISSKNNAFLKSIPSLLSQILSFSDGMVPSFKAVAAHFCFNQEAKNSDMVVTATGELVYSHYAEVPTLLPKDQGDYNAIAKFLISFNATSGRPAHMQSLEEIEEALRPIFKKLPMERNIWYYDLFYLLKLGGLTSYYQQNLSRNIRIFNPIFTKEMINHSMGLQQELRDHRKLQRHLIVENDKSLNKYLVNGFKVVLPTPRTWLAAKFNYGIRLLKKTINLVLRRPIFSVSYVNYSELLKSTDPFKDLDTIKQAPELPVPTKNSSENYVINFLSLAKWLKNAEQQNTNM